MKVYKDDRGYRDLERQIERLKLDKRELEKKNKQLKKELEDVREALARVSGSVH